MCGICDWSVGQVYEEDLLEAALRCLAMVGAGIAYGMAVASAAAHQGPGRDQALALVRACGVEPTTFMKYGRCECCGTSALRQRCPNCYRDLCPSCTARPTCAHSHSGAHEGVNAGVRLP